jgi:hypothetical protein
MITVKVEDLIPDQNSRHGGEEIIDAFDQWKAGRQVVDLIKELGINIGTAEMSAWLNMMFDASDAIPGMDVTTKVHSVGCAMVFGLWLGSRMERMGRGDQD